VINLLAGATELEDLNSSCDFINLVGFQACAFLITFTLQKILVS